MVLRHGKKKPIILLTRPIVVEVELAEKDGKPVLNDQSYDLIGEFKNNIIDTNVLGKAFEPEQRFEAPDGSEIQISEDYFGNHRGVSTIPGPFASKENAEKDALGKTEMILSC